LLARFKTEHESHGLTLAEFPSEWQLRPRVCP
jgi:hypothetical protein